MDKVKCLELLQLYATRKHIEGEVTENGWQHISNEMQAPVEEIKNLMEQLFRIYVKEKLKMTCLNRRHDSKIGRVVFKSSWFAFEVFEALENAEKEKHAQNQSQPQNVRPLLQRAETGAEGSNKPKKKRRSRKEIRQAKSNTNPPTKRKRQGSQAVKNVSSNTNAADGRNVGESSHKYQATENQQIRNVVNNICNLYYTYGNLATTVSTPNPLHQITSAPARLPPPPFIHLPSLPITTPFALPYPTVFPALHPYFYQLHASVPLCMQPVMHMVPTSLNNPPIRHLPQATLLPMPVPLMAPTFMPIPTRYGSTPSLFALPPPQNVTFRTPLMPPPYLRFVPYAAMAPIPFVRPNSEAVSQAPAHFRSTIPTPPNPAVRLHNFLTPTPLNPVPSRHALNSTPSRISPLIHNSSSSNMPEESLTEYNDSTDFFESSECIDIFGSNDPTDVSEFEN